MAAIDGFSSAYLDNIKMQQELQRSQASSAKTKGALNGLSNQPTEEELTDAVKSFESYFVEQMLKEMKKSVDAINGDKDKDPFVSSTVDYFMDSTIQTLAAQMVEDYGSSFTDTMVEQLKRNYNIPETKSTSDVTEQS
ncbi:MAG: hypothetical protein II785_01025 [Lachnospiraceae bacterium]|nr:hypothetical protein [Lachnospiraceae bacterium]SFT55258.1 flagellar protein FlgJ [Lachnospiraceae bacterium XBD2001]MBQ1608754.1 hypothetical protein [Lachnospiraceae bacterium]MBQ2316876.1 hypothetical protein [Lachnospiraceae bacterium]MBQ2466146.1 hypothetical protein [Lachnospiraceae bacterium]